MSPRIKTLKAIRAKIRPEPVREPLPPPPKQYAPPRAGEAETALRRPVDMMLTRASAAVMGEVRRPVAFGGYLILRFRQHSASNFSGSVLNRESPNAQLAVLALPDH